MNVRVPDELHQRARIISIKTGRSLSEVVEELLQEWVQEQEKKIDKKNK